MSDIFISYASADRSRVMPLVDELQRRGWSVWWDRTIRPGKTWDQVIEAALDEARCVIVLWSRDSVQSDWVRTEADEARRRGILVPALLDDVPIPLAFRRMQAANLVQWSRALPSAEFDELIRAITEVLSDGAPLAPEIKPRPATVALPVPGPDPVPTTTRQRHFWSVGSPRRSMAAIGATLLACVAGPAWYFAFRSPRSLAAPASAESKVTEISPIPAKGRNNAIDGLNYVFIPAGKFVMGCSPDDTECDADEKPPHAEQIAKGFRLGQTEVTQAAWKKVNGDDPSYFKGDQLPVETVDWDQATAYCKAIGGRLPTEKEWEYAARGGTTNSRYGDLDAIAWYSANSGRMTHPTGLKQANAFGLYDMLGNVWEWTSDAFDAGHKSVRGGSWLNLSSLVRASFRIRNERPAGSNIGLRCVWESP